MTERLISPYDRSVDYAELAGSVPSLSPLYVRFRRVGPMGDQLKSCITVLVWL